MQTHVVLRAAEPTDQEERETIARNPAHAAGFQWMQRGKLRLELVHSVVEALDERPDRRFTAEALEGRGCGRAG